MKLIANLSAGEGEGAQERDCHRTDSGLFILSQGYILCKKIVAVGNKY